MIDYLKSLILEAGEVFRKTRLSVIKQKTGQGVNLVTAADIAIDSYLKKSLRQKFPSHFLLTEESQIHQIPNNAEDIWIIDPLDGTTVATFGIPHYGISIAYVHQQEVVYGVVLDLPNQTLYWAQKSHGAFVGKNRRLKIRNHDLKNSLASTGANYQWSDFKQDHAIMTKLYHAGGTIVMLGSACIQSALVAENKLTLFYEHGLKPWDIAAAKLIIEEAGGIAASFTGELDIFNPQTFVCGSQQAVTEFKKLI